MIRKDNENDMDAMLDIWLTASLKAHHFVDARFQKFNVENMCNIHLATSNNYIYEKDAQVVGFYALRDNDLAALLKSKIKALEINYYCMLKKQHPKLTLSVYKENELSCQFYLSQGFKIDSLQNCKHNGHPEYTMRFDRNA